MSPVYSYKCDNCGWKVDLNRSISDESPAPICGDCLVSTTKVFHAPAAIFKGQGWGSSK